MHSIRERNCLNQKSPFLHRNSLQISIYLMQTMQTIRTDVITSCWEEMRCRESSDQTGISCLKQDWETKCLLLKQRPWDVTSRSLSKEPTIEKRSYLDLAETRVRDGISSIKYLPREMNWAPTVCHITFILYLFLRGKVAQTWPTKLQILAMNLVSHPFCRASRLVFLFFCRIHFWFFLFSIFCSTSRQ